jgi:hypothetical protein
MHIGVKLDFGIDTYNAVSPFKVQGANIQDKSLTIRSTMQVEYFFGNKNLLVLHGGVGVASNSNPRFKDIYTANGFEFTDAGVKGNDDMLCFILGLTPTFPLSKNILLIGDASFLLQRAHYYLNRSISPAEINKWSGLFTCSLGLGIKL